MKKKWIVLLMAGLLSLSFTGCNKTQVGPSSPGKTLPETASAPDATTIAVEPTSATEHSVETTEEKTLPQTDVPTTQDESDISPTRPSLPTFPRKPVPPDETMPRFPKEPTIGIPTPITPPVETMGRTEEAPKAKAEAPLIVIDAGHQAKANHEKEPIGPGARIRKAKVSSGTSGVVSGLHEYQLNLILSLKLEKLLTERGYCVLMIRKTDDVNISNAERAEIANKAKAAAFLRVHANGSDNPDTEGALTICQTPKNPYNAKLYPESHRLSECLLNGIVRATSCKKLFVWETDSMSGINWCKVPVSIIEVGYMSNPKEDALFKTEAYQNKLAEGMANGVDMYFGR